MALATSDPMDTIRGALLAVVDSSTVSPLTRNCARRVPALVQEVSPLPAHAFQKRGCGTKSEALDGLSATRKLTQFLATKDGATFEDVEIFS